MSLVSSELRLRWISLTAWAVAIAALVALVVGFYPSVRDNSALNSVYEELGPSAQALLGGSDATSAAGYLSTQLFAFFLPAVLLVFVLGRAAATLAGEEEDRTLDLLLAQPLPRWSAYSQKTAALACGLAGLGVATLIPLLALNGPVEFNLPVANLIAVVLQMLLFCFALGAWTQALAAAFGRRVVGLAVVVGYAVISYLVYGLSSNIDWLEHLRPGTLWRWYLGNDPLTSGIGWQSAVVMCGTAIVGIVVGTALFDRRDLRA